MTRMMRAAGAVVLLLGAWFATEPRAHAADLDNLLTGYSLTSWNDGDGRPLGSVYALAQDRDGYLWIGADAGLFRFDGSRFTAWEVMSDTPPPATAATALSVSPDGSLWVGFADGVGVRRIREGRMQPPDPGLDTSGSVTDLVEDHHGMAWAIGDGVLFRRDHDRWQPVQLPWPQREGRVLHLMVRRNGDLWVGTRWAIFNRRVGAEAFEVVKEGYVWDINEDADGRIWTTDIAAGFRRLGAPAPPRHALEGAGYRLMHDRRGNLWVATFGEGLWRVHDPHDRSPSVERAALRTGLSSDSVQSLIEDRDGNIWVGTTGGLHRLTQRKLTPVENVGFVVAVEPADHGLIWAGTTNGVVSFSTATPQWQRLRTGSPAPDVRSLYQSPNGTLWVGATDGLWRLANGGLVKVPLPLPASTQVLSIAPDGQGGLWIGDGDWVYRWDAPRLTPLDLPRVSGRERITFAQADRHGRLWIGFAGGQLGVLRSDGTLRTYGSDDGLSHHLHKTIHALFEDHDGTIWVGGSGGLSRFIGDRFATVSRDHGLPGNRVWAIVEDEAGRLWLNVDRGVVSLDRDEVAKALADRSYRLQYRLYDTPDGVAGAPVGIIGATRASNGVLLFVRGGGLTLANPRDLNDDRALTPAPVRIEAAVANERRFSATASPSFPPGTRRLQINYTVLTLTGSNKIRFRYRLDGFDTDWVEAGARRVAFYTNLSPRSYRFRVEANVEDGAVMPSTAIWDFAIQPTFSQTNWFYGLCAAALAAAVWAAWRFRLGIVRHRFTLVLAERARLSREMHDTLLQSLVGVTLQFDAISRNLGPASAAARDQLTRIRRQVEVYIREARQSIVDLRSPFLETIDLAAALREFGKNAVADRDVRFQATTTGTPGPRAPHLETQLLRIGQEAITNAIRHANAARIHLELRYDAQVVTLRVFDDGRGFDVGDGRFEAGRHFGLTSMRERAEQVGARFTIDTTIGRGTSIEVVAPVTTGAEPR